MIIRRNLWCRSFSLVMLGLAFQSTPAVAGEPPAPLQQKYPLQQIVLIDSPADLQKPLPPGADFVSAFGQLAKLDTPELAQRLREGKDRPIDPQLLGAIVQVLTIYVRQNDFPVAQIVVPEQNIRQGVLRLIVVPGKLREIRVEGNHWFSQSQLTDRLGVAQGDTIRYSELDRAAAWANNTNPFRQLKLNLHPVANTGEFDLVVGVQERLPLRVSAIYDDGGNAVTGYDRYTGGITYGNMWGRDHQLSYHFTTTHDADLFKAHSMSYQAPLRWRHVIQASATFVKVNATLEDVFQQRGESSVADAKYIIPFKFSRWAGEVSGAVGFRRANNNLEFIGFGEVLGTPTDAFTGSLGASAIREDQRGKWITSLTLTGSPGKLNSRSGSADYRENRIGANPRFAYAQLLIQRGTFLTPDLVSNLRLYGQVASTNLLSSEQLTVGGVGTVRGYNQTFLAGDHGFVAGHELQQRMPGITLSKKLPKLDWSGVFFWDFGRTYIKSPLFGQTRSAYLASAGLGVRANVGNYFSASVDYGRQLEKDETPGANHGRFHIKATLSY